MERPNATLVRSLSKVDFAARGYPPPTGSATDSLQVVVDQANSYIELITGRPLDSSMPALLAPIATQAARMRAEQIVMQSQEDTVETAGDVDLIASFTAGSYSETRKDPERRAEQRALNPWPALNDLLWMMLGLMPGEVNPQVDTQRDYWRWLLGLSPNPPAWGIAEVDWSSGLSGNSSLVDVWSEPWSLYL